MWIDPDDEESAPFIHQIKDNKGKSTGNQKLQSPLLTCTVRK